MKRKGDQLMEAIFGRRLKAARLAAGLSRAEVVKKLRPGCRCRTAKTLSRLERGKSTLRLPALWGLASLYGIAPEAIIIGAEEEAEVERLATLSGLPCGPARAA